MPRAMRLHWPSDAFESRLAQRISARCRARFRKTSSAREPGHRRGQLIRQRREALVPLALEREGVPPAQPPAVGLEYAAPIAQLSPLEQEPALGAPPLRLEHERPAGIDGER